MHAWTQRPCMHDLKPWRDGSDLLPLFGLLAELACSAVLCASLRTGDQQAHTRQALPFIPCCTKGAAVGKPMHLSGVTEYLMGICVVLPAI